jgi:REP element-mobilizing transposase RayT
MGAPLAYFLTWTCYASWLHGDERGSRDAFGRAMAPDRAIRASDAERAKSGAIELCPEERAVVLETIRDHCSIRDWSLLAVNVRTNHVHVVVRCPGVPPETALSQFKAWATRRLRENGYFNRKTWTKHGSTIYLWTADQVDEKVHYVQNCQ